MSNRKQLWSNCMTSYAVIKLRRFLWIPMVVHTEISIKSQNVYFERGPNFSCKLSSKHSPGFAMFANITTYKIILLNYLRLVMSRSVNATVLSLVVNFSQSSAKSWHKQTQWIMSQFYYLLFWELWEESHQTKCYTRLNTMNIIWLIKRDENERRDDATYMRCFLSVAETMFT